MFRTTSIALAALLAASTVGGTAFAQSETDGAKTNDTNQTQMNGTETQPMAPDTTTTGSTTPMESGDASVVYMKDLQREDPARGMLEERAGNPTLVGEAQAAVNADPKLRQQLEAQSISMTNVIAVEKAADGSTIVYVQ